MNRVLATTLEYLNFIIVLIIIASSAVGAWAYVKSHPVYGSDPSMLAAGVAIGAIVGFVAGALVGGMIAFVALIEKHLREIRGHAAEQTDLFRSIEELARADASGAELGPQPSSDGGFGEPTRYQRDPRF